MRSNCLKYTPLILAAILPLGACEDDEIAGPGDGEATLSVFLTDAPGDVENVWVELLSVTAHGGGGGSLELLDEPTDLILLTELVETVQLLQVIPDFNAATYSQLRLVVGDAVLQSKEGGVYVKGDPEMPMDFGDAEIGELQCPSCSQTGIKVKVPNDEVVIEEGAVGLVLDFDVPLSFGHKAGNSGKWILHPVIHGTLVGDADGDGDILDDLGLANSISGTVVLADGVTIPTCPTAGLRAITDFIPTATAIDVTDGDGQPLVWSGSVDGTEATFLIGFLPQGSYTMGFVGTIDLTPDRLTFQANMSQAEVTMAGADVTDFVYTITSAECAPIG